MSSMALSNVSYRYPLSNHNAIEDVSYSFEEAKTYGIIGANGSGKTTLCNILRGFAPRFYQGTLTGAVTLDGENLEQCTAEMLARKIGILFQNPFTQISGVKDTVREEIAYGMENLGYSHDQMAQRVEELLHLIDLDSLANKNPFDLSGGQKQRVALASVLAPNPDIVILDEPTSQLDPKGTEDVFKVIGLLKASGKTVVLVEHKVDLIASYCDEAILMSKGHIALSGDVHTVLSNQEVLSLGGQLPQVALFFHSYAAHGGYPSNAITVREAYEQLKGVSER